MIRSMAGWRESHIVTRQCGAPRTGCRSLVRSPFSEGNAVLWLWVWPDLLGWRWPITWLFSPVNERNPWPGDLWGVDSRGTLIIVEAKTRNTRPVDPFEDFVGRGSSTMPADHAPEVHSESLLQRWRGSFADELAFMNRHLPALRLGEPLQGRYPGVVTYSYHRGCIQAWPHLYVRRLAPMFRHPEYATKVERCLKAREQAGNPPPHFVGLVAVVNGRSAALSRRGLDAYDALRGHGGERAGRVRLVAVEGRPAGRRARVSSWELKPVGEAARQT